MRGCRGVAVSALFLALAAGCAAPPTDNDLSARAESSQPAWQSYQEDVKSQMGAGPIAEWRGEPVEAIQQALSVRVTFAIHGPWAARAAAVPVMMRDPQGRVYRSTATEKNGDRLTYGFPIEGASSGGTFPWVEVKFPNGSKRLVLDEQGTWQAAQ